MKKNIALILMIFGIFNLFSQNKTAKFITNESTKKETIEESIEYLKSQVEKIESLSEKRAIYIFLASLQEQLAFFDEAKQNYAKAAGISANDVEGMPKKSNEQLVLDAVRCSLCCGDYATAQSYLSSSVQNSKNPEIQAFLKLYSQWSQLCKAENSTQVQEPILILQAYLKLESMEIVRPIILLTLWYITGEKKYSNELIDKFPKSTETSVVKGDIQLLPTPFWFFVPKIGEAETESGTFDLTKTEQNNLNENKTNENENLTEQTEFTKYQLGLFRTEKNATLLAKELKSKGFDSFITTEKRASGTTYFIVIVNSNNEKNVADKLRNAGYDCYPVD